jgi:hypothetical protein
MIGILEEDNKKSHRIDEEVWILGLPALIGFIAGCCAALWMWSKEYVHYIVMFFVNFPVTFIVIWLVTMATFAVLCPILIFGKAAYGLAKHCFFVLRRQRAGT